MNPYRIPKHREPVTVVMVGGLTLHVELFLSEYAAQHSGVQRVDDLLNGPDDFLPAIDVDLDSTTLLNRQAIAFARLQNAPPSDFTGEANFMDHRVDIVIGGATVHGNVRHLCPREKSRLTDFLNEASLFFQVTEEGRVTWVNKRHVVRALVAKK